MIRMYFLIFVASFGSTQCLGTILHFNVGGYEFAVADDVIKSANVSYFNAYLGGNFKVVLDKKKNYFISQPKNVGKVIEHYLQTKTILKNADPQAKKTAIEFFNLPVELKENETKWAVSLIQLVGLHHFEARYYECRLCNHFIWLTPHKGGILAPVYEHILRIHTGEVLPLPLTHPPEKDVIYFKYPVFE